MRVWLNGRAPAFQAGCVGSIPITRSIGVADCAQFATPFLLRKSRRSSQRSVSSDSRIKAGLDAFLRGKTGKRKRRGNVGWTAPVRDAVFTAVKAAAAHNAPSTPPLASRQALMRFYEAGRRNGRTGDVADCAQFATLFLLRKSRRSSQRSVSSASRIKAGLDVFLRSKTGKRKRRGNVGWTAPVRDAVFAAQKPPQLTTLRQLRLSH